MRGPEPEPKGNQRYKGETKDGCGTDLSLKLPTYCMPVTATGSEPYTWALSSFAKLGPKPGQVNS